jgi:hypothetical protein
VQVQESGDQRGDESQTPASLATTEQPLPTLSLATVTNNADGHAVPPEGLLANELRQPVQEELVPQSGAPRESPNRTEHETEYPAATSSRSRARHTNSAVQNHVPRQSYLKLMFWKRYRSVLESGSPKKKATTPAEEHVPGRPTQQSENMASATETSQKSPIACVTFSHHIITISIMSPHIYRLEDGTYIGRLRYLSPPSEAEVIWSTIRKRLVTDLRLVTASLPKTFATRRTHH